MTIKLKKSVTVFSVKEAAQFLGLSRGWLDRDRSNHNLYGSELKVPYVQLSARKVLYRKADLEAFLDEKRIG